MSDQEHPVPSESADDQSPASTFAAMMEKTISDALSKVDTAMDAAKKAHAEAIELQEATSQEKRRIEENARQEADAIIDQHLTKMKAAIRQEVFSEVLCKLVQAGQSAVDISRWLDVPESEVAKAKKTLGFSKLGPSEARVIYLQSGRGGTLKFQMEEITIPFHWEFGGGDAVALIFIPKEEHWEVVTGISLTLRQAILTFVAEQVVFDQAPSCRYEIGPDVITILY